MKNPISVSVLNNYIKRNIETDPVLRNVYVIGEVSSLSVNKYTYFNLKEDTEIVSCVAFSNNLGLKEGDKIIVSGSLNLYTKASRYQIRVSKAEIVGLGDMSIEFAKLKIKLETLGYFNPLTKKSINRYPKKIGLITADKSAAYNDFLKIFYDNNYTAQIVFYPSLVQGDSASKDMVQAIKHLDSLGLDVIVLTRGGGSKEDLSAFNDEGLCKAIFEANTPIISAVGHEIDTSLADFTADLRLQTPTKAAEYLVEYTVSSRKAIHFYNQSIESSLRHKLDNLNNTIESIRARIELKSPEKLLTSYANNINYTKLLIDRIVQDKLNNSSKTLHSLRQNIDQAYLRIRANNLIEIRNLDESLVSLDKIIVGDSYRLITPNRRFKIKIEEEYSG